MIEEGRSGKAPRVRRHQAARTPYARPPAAAGASTPAATPIKEVETALDTQNKSSLLASVLNAATTPLRAAATLINKVCNVLRTPRKDNSALHAQYFPSYIYMNSWSSLPRVCRSLYWEDISTIKRRWP